MTIYMMVTDDKFELPVAVADSPKELAEMIGKNVNAIYKAIDTYEQMSLEDFMGMEASANDNT